MNTALVVGYGRMGRFHARTLRDLGYTVITVDPDPTTGADHASIAEATLATKGEFTAAAVATPAEALVETAFQLAGTPMLIEKPYATNMRDGTMLAAYLHQAGAPVCVGFVERFNPRIRELHPGFYTTAHFTRWNDRPSPDIPTDLLLHDVDLMIHLGISLNQATFDTRDAQPERVRRIVLGNHYNDEPTTTVDLMDHDQSPLHALWHAFLSGKPVPGPRDALRALELLPYVSTAPQACAA